MKNDVIRALSTKEWILTNGLGGYALSYGDFINKRKYNGYLISGLEGLRRIHTVSGVEEHVETDGGSFYLDSNHYPDAIFPKGYRNICKAWLRPYPSAVFSSIPFSDDYVILREVLLVPQKNAVVVKYSNFGKSKIKMVLRPKFTLRDHHALNISGTWDWTQTSLNIEKSESFEFTRKDSNLTVCGYIKGAELIDDKVIYRSVYYPHEAMRGYDSVEDIIAPVRIDLLLEPKKSYSLLLSLGKVDDPEKYIKSAENYYKDFPLPNDHARKIKLSQMACESRSDTIFDIKDYKKILQMAAQDFIVKDEDIIAGFPWFGAWGRDTMISLSALKHVPDGKKFAIKILKKYGASLKDGILPNTFGEGGEGLNYDTVDASLWFVLRAFEFAPDDKELFNYCRHVIMNYAFNENNPFFVAEDGLIEIRKSNRALTWMDAKVYDVPVTPRYGKPVEINALWFNALSAMQVMCDKLGESELIFGNKKMSYSDLNLLKNKVSESMQKFVGEDYLADRIEDDCPVWEIRPNAVIALSLPFDFVDENIFKIVWYTAREKLLTPYGLRSLDQFNPAFKQMYVGNQKQRDYAYHQGTVWGFLLLPFVKLTTKAFKIDKKKDELRQILTTYVWNLRDSFMRGEFASVAEVWDGGDPKQPKGCPAQAWSVFSLLEIEKIIEG